jgi:hypothetical protein
MQVAFLLSMANSCRIGEQSNAKEHACLNAHARLAAWHHRQILANSCLGLLLLESLTKSVGFPNKFQDAGFMSQTVK